MPAASLRAAVRRIGKIQQPKNDSRYRASHFNRNVSVLEAGCQPTFFLSRADVKALDEYEQEFGDLIIRFLKVIFLSILWSPNDVDTREAIGLIMTQRYMQAFEVSGATSSSLANSCALGGWTCL
jgi:hypothetical protein